jgi:ribonuclease VapC
VVIAVDTSAIVAIVLGEPERTAFSVAIHEAAKVLVSTVSVVETKMVLHARRGEKGLVLADDLFRLPQFEITTPTLADIDAAIAAFLLYGKASGYRAALNFGDVFSYALAKVRNLPLLFKRHDFSETDLRPAVPCSTS